MDIRSIIGQIIPIGTRSAEKVERNIKSDSATERDADGRSGQDSHEHQRPMTDEEFAKHVEHLRSLESVRDNGLVIKIETQAGLRYVILFDAQGVKLRRISELDLWSLNIDKDVKKGKLLSRSA